MNLNWSKNLSQDKPFLSSFLIIIGITLLALVIGNVLGMVAIITVGGLSLENLGDFNSVLSSSPKGWWAVMVAQGLAAFFTFIIPVFVYWKYIEKRELADLSPNKFPAFGIILLMFLLQLLLSPINGEIQAWNKAIDLPDSLQSIEDFMKNSENAMADLTEKLTKFDTIAQFLVAFLVIAVLAGVGEELLFRGLLQRKLMLLFKNHHIGIWLAAIFFSAIHFQFYGFFPRMILGAALGYFYYFTGNIWVPILGHIFNNGLAIVILHLVNKKLISSEFEKMETVPMPYLLSSIILFIGTFWLFIKKTDSKKS